MNKEKDFFKTCFNIVAGLDVKNESQAIAKEVVLSEVENLQQENRKQKEIINEATSIINEHFKHHPELLTENQREYDLIRKIEHILKEK